MRGWWSVFRKEMYSMFASPIFYVVAFTFLVIAGYFFYSAVAYYNLISFQASQNPYAGGQLNVTDMVLRPLFMDLSIVLLLISPLLTMRVYAEERKAGTMELLFTLPLKDVSTLLAKFAAILAIFFVILMGTLPCVLLLQYISEPNWKVIFSGYLGLTLLGGAFISIGVFTSSLTQNQIIAAVLAFGGLMMFWVIGWSKNLVGPAAAVLVDYLSLTKHFDSFAKGVLDVRDMLYYLVFTVFFLFLTLRQIESYRYRG